LPPGYESPCKAQALQGFFLFQQSGLAARFLRAVRPARAKAIGYKDVGAEHAASRHLPPEGPHSAGGGAMLVLTRRIHEEIVIAGSIRVTIVEVHGERARIGISAPSDVAIRRVELVPRAAASGTADDLESGAGGSRRRHAAPVSL
jgi:carbon storage regulator